MVYKVVRQLIIVKVSQVALGYIVTRINDGEYVISYSVNNQVYKFLTRTSKGPRRVIQILNDRDMDVTDEVLPYLGPRYDWHGQVYTADNFASQFLVFHMDDCTVQCVEL